MSYIWYISTINSHVTVENSTHLSPGKFGKLQIPDTTNRGCRLVFRILDSLAYLIRDSDCTGRFRGNRRKFVP